MSNWYEDDGVVGTYTEDERRSIVAERADDRLTEDPTYYTERVEDNGVAAVVTALAGELGDYLHYMCGQDLSDAAYEGVAERALVKHGIIPPQ